MTAIVLQGSPSEKITKPANNEIFASLVQQYADDVYRYCYWICGKKDIAEDLTQDTLMRAWKAAHKLNDPKAVKSWLFTIARRENARRFERKQLEMTDIETTELPEKQQQYDTSTEAFVMRQAIKQLPAEYREPLLLQVVYGYSQKEIAKHLGVTTAGAGTRLFRARNKLRELVEGTQA